MNLILSAVCWIRCTACLSLALPVIAVSAVYAQETPSPVLAPKPYRIGVAPSHITKPTAPLFGERANEWDEVREQIDFYKVYSLQAAPPDWATRLPVNAFAEFAKEHQIAVDAEFGNFRPGVGEGRAAAERARAMHAWMRHRGVKLDALHLDGPVRRMMASDQEVDTGLTLDQTAEEIADFLVDCRKAFPGTRIGLITNFPNWHYTPEHPGMLGTWTNRSGVHYRDALEAVYIATKKKGSYIDFVEVDCPLNYYRATANRADPTRRVNNAAKFKALQKWCEDRDIEFWLVVNFDTNPQKVANKPHLGNRFFHDQTLSYIRRLRRDGIFPDCFTIQSWYKLPQEHLPEDGGYSFMHTARDSIRLIRQLFPQPDASVERATERPSPVKLILDTDMSGDCDDAAALGLLHALADCGECDLLAVTTNRKDLANASAGATDAINTYYGRPDIPIGVGRQAPTALQRTSPYTAALRERFPNDIGPDDRAPDAIEVYKQALSGQPDGTVTICSVGALTNLAELWRRHPDLVRAKVRRLVVMGGEYPQSFKPRTNIATHIESARIVADQWPTEIVWHGFEVGKALITGARLKQTSHDNPVRRAYELRPHGGRFAIDGGKPSYDQAAALFAVRGATPEHWEVISGGRVSVDETGMTAWRASPSGTHAYVKIACEPERLAREIENLMITPPKYESVSHPARLQAADTKQVTWPPPEMRELPADYLERLRTALQLQSDRFNDPRTKTRNPVIMVRVGIAALALGQHGEELNSYFEADAFGWKPSEQWGFSLFSASYVRLYALYNNRTGVMKELLSRKAQENLERSFWECAKAYSKLAEAKIDVWESDGSENHHITSRVSDFLVAQFLKDIPDYASLKYDDGSSLQEQYEARLDYWSRWLDQRARRGLFYEDGSSYENYTIEAFFNLRDFAEDPILRHKADIFLDLVFANMAEETMGSVRGGPKTRTKEEGFEARYYALLFAQGKKFREISNYMLPTSSYYPSGAIVDLARDTGRRGTYSWSKRCPGFKKPPRPGDPPKWNVFDDTNSIIRNGFSTLHFHMGSHGVDTNAKVNWDARQQRWQGIMFANDPMARISMDGVSVRGTPGNPEKDGYISNPFKTIQDRNVMVTMKWGPNADKGVDPNLWIFFSYALDFVEEEDGWIFVKSGDAFAAVKVVGGYEWVTPWERRESLRPKSFVRQSDFHCPIITVVNDAADYKGDFAAFKKALKAQPIMWKNGVLKFATITHEGPLKPGKVNGKTVDLRPSRVNDSPFIRSHWNSGIVYLRKGDETLKLDFSNRKNPVRTVGAPVTSEYPPGAGSATPIVF